MDCDARYYDYMKMFVHRNETRQEGYKDCILWCIFIIIVLYMEGGVGNKGNKRYIYSSKIAQVMALLALLDRVPWSIIS